MDSSLDALKQIYKASAAPVALADGTLSALWANEAALKSWPSLHMPDGLGQGGDKGVIGDGEGNLVEAHNQSAAVTGDLGPLADEAVSR